MLLLPGRAESSSLGQAAFGRPFLLRLDIVVAAVPIRVNINGGTMETLKAGTDTLFILMGAVMVLAMHAGFAFLELGTVRRKNQVNALVKILVDFSVSTGRLFFRRLHDCVRRLFLFRCGIARAKKRLRSGEVFFPAHVRSRGSRHRVGGHR
jgi:hypothetical protein